MPPPLPVDSYLPRIAEALESQRAAVLVAAPGAGKTTRVPPGVLGGSACIVRTRIAVWMLESYRRLGWSEATILSNYPTPRAVDLVQAWGYVGAHRSEIDEEIRQNEAA